MGGTIMIEELNESNKKYFDKLNERAYKNYDFNDLSFNDGMQKTVFMYKEEGKYVAFIICGIHSEPVVGCYSGNVAYIEALYVLPKYRQEGKGTALIEKFESWARENGCYEIAGNIPSNSKIDRGFYEKNGFEQVAVNVHFRKKIKGEVTSK